MASNSVCFALVLFFSILSQSYASTYWSEHHTLESYDEFIKTKRTAKNADCPCNDASLCNNVKMQHNKEVFGFTGGDQSSNISIYNWTHLTTIAWAPTANASDFMCYAHSKNVRLIASTHNIPFTNNATERMEWIQQTFEQIEYYHFDGVTFDYESPMFADDVKSKQYTQLINETTAYFHTNMPGSQTSVCVAWQAYLTDGRAYDYYSLSLVSDLLYVMDYDTQSQRWNTQCLAAANAPYQGMQRGVESFLNLGIDPQKLILGQPWYGYNYTCLMSEMESEESKYCPIALDPFRGVNCSDAAGNEKEYSFFLHIPGQMTITIKQVIA